LGLHDARHNANVHNLKPQRLANRVRLGPRLRPRALGATSARAGSAAPHADLAAGEEWSPTGTDD
jgi:hypothetical protein